MAVCWYASRTLLNPHMGLGPGTFTPLHFDLSPALNLLTWVHDYGQVGATWFLFAPSVLADLCCVLGGPSVPGGSRFRALHDRNVELTDAVLRSITASGIVYTRIEQRLGHGVVVPAGWGHFVVNRQACIKVAVDFVPLEGLSTCFDIAADARLLPRGHVNRVDTLCLPGVLWGAFESLESWDSWNTFV